MVIVQLVYDISLQEGHNNDYTFTYFMLDWIRLFGLLPVTPLKDTFLLYKRVTEQYKDPEVLNKVKLLIPKDIVLKTNAAKTVKENEEQDVNVVPLLKWFKNEFMKWTPKYPVCKMCINNMTSDGSKSSQMSTTETTPIMYLKKIIEGNSWKMRKVEIYACSLCNFEYIFPRYGEILKIAETKTGRCSEWSFLFGAMLSSLGIKTRIVHDFLDHCWNEIMLFSSSSTSSKNHWIHIDSTLDYPISLNHPHYYEENWKKEYQFVLAFSAEKIEDVTKTYTLRWETILQRRILKNKNNSIDFAKLYSKI